MFYKH